MEGRFIFMTGATSGLGKEACCSLANEGAHMIIAARSVEKGKDLMEYYKKKFPHGKGSINVYKGDLSSFSSVSELCEQVNAKYNSLDMIILNAGIMNFKFLESTDGIEETLQVNVLSNILIIDSLWELLKKSGDAKLIITASALHRGSIHFEDIEFRRSFSSYKSYSQSKLAVILLTRYLAAPLSKYAIGVYAQHPGIVNTNLGDRAGALSRFIFKMMGKSPEKGAENLLFLCRTDNKDLQTGEYYAKMRVKKITKESYDLSMAKKLIDLSKGYLAPYLKDSNSIIESL